MSNVFKRFVLLECDKERAWAALTRPEQITQWLAERAEVDLVEGGFMKLASVVPLVTGSHRIRTLEKNRALTLEWQIEGLPTRATFRIEDHGALVRVVVTHDVGNAKIVLDAVRDTMETELGHLDHVWGYAFLMLKSYVETGAAKARLKPGEDTLKVDLGMPIAASPSRVFKALIDSDELKEWAFVGPCLPEGGKPLVDARVGGRYSFGWKSEEQGLDGPDEIIEYEDGKKITYTWHGSPKTLVSWSVEPEDGGVGTLLRLQHSGFVSDPKRVLEYKLGWAHFMYSLADLVTKNRAADKSNFAGKEKQRRFDQLHGTGEGA